MESYEVFKDAFKNNNPKVIASKLENFLALVYKLSLGAIRDCGSGSRNPLGRLKCYGEGGALL